MSRGENKHRRGRARRFAGRMHELRQRHTRTRGALNVESEKDYPTEESEGTVTIEREEKLETTETVEQASDADEDANADED